MARPVSILSARMRDELRRIVETPPHPGVGRRYRWETSLLDALREATDYDRYLEDELAWALEEERVPPSYLRDLLAERTARTLGWKHFISTMRPRLPDPSR